LKSSVQKALPAKSETKRQFLMLETKQFSHEYIATEKYKKEKK
jgi:hypothetical protein